MQLSKNQKQNILDVIRENHFNLSEFSIYHPDSDWSVPLDVKIEYVGMRGYHFTIGKGREKLYRITMTPGSRILQNDYKETDGWLDIMEQLKKWMFRMVEEIQMPDPWANMDESEASPPPRFNSNSMLNPVEQERVITVSEEIIALLKKGNENDERIIEAINVIPRSADKIGRADVFRAALGALIQLGLEGLVSRVDGAQACNMLAAAFSVTIEYAKRIFRQLGG